MLKCKQADTSFLILELQAGKAPNLHKTKEIDIEFYMYMYNSSIKVTYTRDGSWITLRIGCLSLAEVATILHFSSSCIRGTSITLSPVLK